MAERRVRDISSFGEGEKLKIKLPKKKEDQTSAQSENTPLKEDEIKVEVVKTDNINVLPIRGTTFKNQ